MIKVVAGIIRFKGKILITSRPKGTHLEGEWEFPGGKVKDGESLEEALVREIKEELSIEVFPVKKLFSKIHHYKEKSVKLEFLEAKLQKDANITPNDNQQFKWVYPSELKDYEFVEADKSVVEMLNSDA